MRALTEGILIYLQNAEKPARSKMRVSVTGSFASGKSIFSRMLSMEKIEIIDADAIGKNILRENIEEIYEFLKLDMHEDYLQYLKTQFLKDEKIFIKYNSWMYDRLPQAVLKECFKYDNSILDAALVFEWGIEKSFDMNILIRDGSFDDRIRRAEIQGRHPDKNIYLLLEKHQMNDEERLIFADVVIENTNGEADLKKKAEDIYEKIFGHCF